MIYYINRWFPIKVPVIMTVILVRMDNLYTYTRICMSTNERLAIIFDWGYDFTSCTIRIIVYVYDKFTA